MEENGISPVVYMDEAMEGSESLQEAVEKTVGMHERANELVKSVVIKKENLSDREAVMANAFIGLQRESGEDIVREKTGFEGIEKYIYVRAGDNATYKLTCKRAEGLKISRPEIWETAEKNTFAETEIKSLADMLDMLSEATGMEMTEAAPEVYVITNKTNFRGASAILDTKKLEEIARKLNSHRLIILPSSVHEMLVTTDCRGLDIRDYHEMVKEVNETQVEPEERLTDRAYVIEIGA